jgi:hypothetical protein
MIKSEMGSGSEPSANPARTLAIFINYRREDTGGQARLLSRELADRFGPGNVYFDVDQKPGIDWLKEIEARGAGAGAFLALIGPRWLPSLKDRRSAVVASGAIDYVRAEIEWALRDWSGVVIPVLVDAEMPAVTDLPRSIEGLVRKQGVALRHAAFDDDLAHLIELLADIAGGAAAPEELPPAPELTIAPAAGSAPAPGVPEPNEEHYLAVIKAMQRGSVVPLLGPSVRGASPDARYLATHLAAEFDLAEASSDLAEVAQHVAVTEGEPELYAAIEQIVATGAKPTPVHEFLAEFPGLLRKHGLTERPQLIISTNYDCALERAFVEAGEPFDYSVYMARDGTFVHFPWDETAPEPSMQIIDKPRRYQDFPIDDRKVQRTVIVKTHGAPDAKFRTLMDYDSYVITEDHYIDYLPTHDIHDSLPIQILEKLRGSRRLFLGYSLRDWNARMVLKRIWQERAHGGTSWAISYRPDAFEKSLWTLVEGVELWAAHSTEYINGLRAVLLKLLEEQGAAG